MAKIEYAKVQCAAEVIDAKCNTQLSWIPAWAIRIGQGARISGKDMANALQETVDALGECADLAERRHKCIIRHNTKAKKE